MQCPVCNKYELRPYAWIPDGAGEYKSEDHYDCANCGPLPYDVVHAFKATVDELEARLADSINREKARDKVIQSLTLEGIPELESRLEAVAGLLRLAKCPDEYCDGKGTCMREVRTGFESYDFESWQCQWCDERDKALDQPQPEEK